MSYTVIRPGNHYASRLPEFGTSPVVKLVTPRLAPSRIGEYLIALPAGGGTTRPVAPGFETFIHALEMATRHGARCLGREDELGHLSAGALADVALWNLDEPGFAGIADPVFALAFGPARPVDTLLVGGRAVVAGGELRTADPVTLAADLRRESARLEAV